jgi:endonuclease YncB( thermonuclease family)
MKRWILAASAFGILIFALSYTFLDNSLTNFLKDTKTVDIDRVIDGDTIVTSSGEHIRMLGINAPETSKNEKYSQEAKQYLSALVLNKTVKIEIEGKDLYNRTLGYVFLNNKNVNKMLIEKGLANYYFPESTRIYYNEFRNAWNLCLQSKINLCDNSDNLCASCIELKKFDYESQEVVLSNKCVFPCNLQGWWIKDEGRKEFVFPKISLGSGKEITVKVGNKTNTQNILFWSGETYVWTRTGDTMFLRDNQSKLVLWAGY